jgi:hypothetical protein
MVANTGKTPSSTRVEAQEIEEELEQLGGDYEDGKEKREWRRRGKSRWARVAALDTWGFYTGGERTTTVPSTNMRRGHAEIVAVRKEEGRGRLLASQKLKRPRCLLASKENGSGLLRNAGQVAGRRVWACF